MQNCRSWVKASVSLSLHGFDQLEGPRPRVPRTGSVLHPVNQPLLVVVVPELLLLPGSPAKVLNSCDGLVWVLVPL